MSTVGHSGALRRLHKSSAKSSEAKAAAMVAVTSSSLYCGKHGLERGSNYLIALFGNRLTILRPTRAPDPNAVLVDFVKNSYRVHEVERGKLNASFVLSRPYGSVHLRMLRWGLFSMNDEVLDRLLASAAAANRTSPPALKTAGEVRVFARMCAAYGPGAEKATAVAEVEITGTGDRKGLLSRKPGLLLATFPDRLVLLDGGATTHAASAPIAAFAAGATTVEVLDRTERHLDVALAGGGANLALRVALHSQARIDDDVVAAIRALDRSRR
ncbi:MAG: hypothetical protein ACT4QF_06390 [Sporichthyaceae bacterium]